MVSRFLMMIALLALIPVSTAGQVLAQAPKDNRTLALEELEAVIIEARNFDNKSALVNVRARAAMLLSYSDPARAESMFLDLWRFVKDQSDSDFDEEQAKLIVLKYLFARNPKLARQLLAEKPKTDKSKDSSETPGGQDDQQQAAKLASQLIEVDPSAAAALLEKSLTTLPTADGLAALIHLRETNSSLSDYVASKELDSLTVQPTIVSLPALQLMTAYAFPSSSNVLTGMEADSSLQTLQYKYFLIGYDVLKISLSETNEALLKQRYTARDLQYRASNQAMIAAILAALSPRFQPSFAVELRDIAAKLAPQMPANLAQITQMGLAKLSGNPLTSDDPEVSFVYALSAGDYDEAGKQLERINDDKKREMYGQLLLKSQARTLLARGDVVGALTVIRKIQDQTARLAMYLDAVKSAKKRRDTDLTRIIIDEARLLIPQTDRNGLHVRALLYFISQLTDSRDDNDVFEFLNSAVTSINALANKSKSEGTPKNPAQAALAQLNDVYSLIDAPEMEQAFSAVGLRDLDRGLAHVRRIDLRPLQLIARLETIQGIIKRPAPKPKTSAKPAVP
jgi:hypothetical protein